MLETPEVFATISFDGRYIEASQLPANEGMVISWQIDWRTNYYTVETDDNGYFRINFPENINESDLYNNSHSIIIRRLARDENNFQEIYAWFGLNNGMSISNANIDTDTDIIKITFDSENSTKKVIIQLEEGDPSTWPSVEGQHDYVPAYGTEGGIYGYTEAYDFSDIYDIQPGTKGYVESRDEYGNGTRMYWYVPED